MTYGTDQWLCAWRSFRVESDIVSFRDHMQCARSRIDHPETLSALRTMLESERDIDCSRSTTRKMLAIANEDVPGVILVDRKLPGYAAGDLIVQLHALTPRPIVIVMDSLPEASRMALRERADVFVSKGDRPEWLLESLRRFVKATLSARSNLIETPACRSIRELSNATIRGDRKT